MARVTNVWVSPAKGAGRMDARDRARAIEGHGLEGCAHARPGSKRQVLFASAEHLEAVGVAPGRIRENFTVDGADVHQWPPGQRLRIGGAEFEITMICDPCYKMDAIRPGLQEEIVGRRGMLARVVATGEVAAADDPDVLAARRGGHLGVDGRDVAARESDVRVGHDAACRRVKTHVGASYGHFPSARSLSANSWSSTQSYVVRPIAMAPTSAMKSR